MNLSYKVNDRMEVIMAAINDYDRMEKNHLISRKEKKWLKMKTSPPEFEERHFRVLSRKHGTPRKHYKKLSFWLTAGSSSENNSEYNETLSLKVWKKLSIENYTPSENTLQKHSVFSKPQN